jgi:hypothetical protein
MELIYARWLSWGTRLALALLAATFLAYALGVSEPLISLERLPGLWSLAHDQFLAATGAPTGWAWLAVAGRGDYANLAAVALLGMVTAVCYLRILPILLARGERTLALLAALQVAVLLLAASGWLAGGH